MKDYTIQNGMKQILLLIVFLIIIACQFSVAQTPDKIIKGELGKKLEDKLTPFIEKILEDHDAVGLSIGITKDDEIIYAKGFGYENIKTKKKTTINTIYHMASVSKPFVATALVKLAEQGKLKLDDPVVKYLPYFKLDGEESKKITIKQILTHTSGMPRNIGSDDWDKPSYGDDALEEYVRSINDAKLEFVPGSKYSYSNSGFDILGDVIAKASGMTFEAYMQKYVLDASGMKNTTYLKPNYLPENWAAPHVLRLTTELWKHYPYNRKHAPSSALHSNILDMAKWGIINLNRGTFKDHKLLNGKSHDLLLTPTFDTPWGEKIGLSWFLQSYEGKKTILHTGEDTGFETQFIMYPEEKVSIAVMANRNDSRTARIANASFEALMDMPIKPYKVSAKYPFGKEMQANGIEAAKALWQKLKANDKDNYFTSEWEINIVGHSLIEAKRYEEAKQVFQFNIEEFPKSPNVYDSYGDALLAEGDKENAIKYFKKALEIDPNFPDPKPKLEKLKVPIDK